jgi:predicted transcriptional regulator
MINKKTKGNTIFDKPPYTVTEKAADYLAKIVETVTRLEFGTGFRRDITLRRRNRVQYYQAIKDSRKTNDSGAFIEFTLSALLDSIKAQAKHQDKHQDKHQVKHQVKLSETMLSVLKSLKHANLSRKEIFTAIGMKGDTRAGRRSIEPLLTDGYIEMTVPDKPNSKLQKYRLTEKGKAVLYNI